MNEIKKFAKKKNSPQSITKSMDGQRNDTQIKNGRPDCYLFVKCTVRLSFF